MEYLFISIVLPFGDGSGKPKVLGVYDSRVKAEARCYRASQEVGYELPTDITECYLNEDIGEIPITILNDIKARCNICHTDESPTWYKCCPTHTSGQGPDVVCEICYHNLHSDKARK